MCRLLALDPDVQTLGAAVAELLPGRGWVLTAAGVVSAERPPRASCALCPPARPRCPHAPHDQAHALALVAALWQRYPLRAGDVLLVEGQYIPRPRPGARQRDPGPLLDLAWIAGAVAGRAAAAAARVYRVHPATWRNGKDPKPQVQARTLASLDTPELELLPRARGGRFKSDAVDAVGLALWGCGRQGYLHSDPLAWLDRVEGGPAASPVQRRRPPREAQPALAPWGAR